jgi:hypothetical protein
MTELQESPLEETPKPVSLKQSCGDTDEAKTCVSVAHTLKSTSLAFSAERLVKKSMDMERDGK